MADLSPICGRGAPETRQVSQSGFIEISPPHVDNIELHAQVPAASPHRQGRREQRLRLQKHSFLHPRLPRDGLHRCDVLPEPQGMLTMGPTNALLWRGSVEISCMGEKTLHKTFSYSPVKKEISEFGVGKSKEQKIHTFMHT